MATNSTAMTNINTKSVDIPPIWPHLVFGLFLFGEVMSIPCYLFLIYHHLATKVAREALRNHVIIIMLIFNFIHLTIDLSLALNHMRLGYFSPFYPAMCLIQQFVDYGIWYGAIFLMFWTSIERHILIFHSGKIATIRGRLVFHYIPLVCFTIYAPTFYFYMIFLYPCEHDYNAAYNMCGGPYYYAIVNAWYIWYESFVHYVIPISLIAIFSIGFIVRVIMQKRRLQQGVEWRRYRKMIIQFVLVSAIYLIFDLPYMIIIIVQQSSDPNFGSNVVSPYISQLTYVPAIILPYASLLTMSELKQKLRALFFCNRNHRAIAPLISRH